MSDETFEAALGYARRGWFVFPLHGITETGQCTCGDEACRDAGKHPSTSGGLKDASADEEKVREWHEAGVLANVAIVTGERSGITVLDVDVGDKGGDATWAELNREAGEPDTLMAETGSGGMHVYFKYNSALNTSSNTLGKGVDCRNDGGYVVAPPSKHRSGGKYTWLNPEAKLANLPKHLSVRKEKRGRKRKDDPTRKKYTIEEIETMLSFIPADDRDMWRNVGIILGREFNRASTAWDVYHAWSEKWDGPKGRNHDRIMHEAFHELSQQEGELSIGTIVRAAIDNGWAPKTGQVPADNFLYYAPDNKYIYRPTGALWAAESVDSSCSPINEAGTITKPSVWLKANRLITSMTKDPIITDEVSQGFDCRDGIVVESEGAALYNAYIPPSVRLGDSNLARPFIDHVHLLLNKPGDADQFLDYMAHRVQHPGEKPRFALMIAGEQGVGKDTAISMCTPAIGPWNVSNIEADDLESQFNEYAASVLTIVSEAANSADISKWAFNERMKVLIAGNPDYMTINRKYGQKYSVRLHNGIIITTNHMTSGIYIPADDRRYDVIACATRGEMGLMNPDARAEYFQELWEWYNDHNGAEHIAAYLAERDISGFKAATGQRQTEAHKEVVSAGFTNDEWVIDCLDALGNPPVVRSDVMWDTLQTIEPDAVSPEKFKRRLGHALNRLGYHKLSCRDRNDGRWPVETESGRRTRVTVYYDSNEIEYKEATKRWQEQKAPF